MNQKTIDVVCAIIIHEDKILTAKRGDDMPHAGFWEFPGGKIEKGETAQQSLFREIKEELDCPIKIEESLPVFPYQYPDKEVVLYPFICSLKDGKPSAKEHAEIAWLTRDELSNVQWLPADVPIVDYLLT